MTTQPTQPTEVEDPHDHRLARGADGLLGLFNQAGVLDAGDVHVARRLCALAEDEDPLVALAVACVVRAVRAGSVCVDLARVAHEIGDPDDDLPWPDPAQWQAAVAASPLVTSQTPALRVLASATSQAPAQLLYLDRHWREEEQVHADLVGRPASSAAPDEAWLEGALDRVFPRAGYDEQRAAARVALTHPTTVLTGGPGTGKTTTVAALLALCAERAELDGDPPLRIALAAPTGKAAARLQQAVETEVAGLPAADRARLAGVRAVTLHRLLGARPDTSSRFRHHRDNRLPHDVVVVDETSMVSLMMMARLLESVRAGSRLILVGDPFQLASVEAGAVLADLVETVEGTAGVAAASLRTSHRFGETIGTLAEAVRAGDADEAVGLLEAGGAHLRLVHGETSVADVRALVVPHALAVLRAAESGDAETALELLEAQRLVCAHREGPFGVRHWNAQVERWLGEETGEPIWSSWYAGRPLLVTANDYGLGVYNGDVGVTVRSRASGRGSGALALRAAVAGSTGRLDLATSRLAQVETMHALTIHKSQGGQAGEVIVVLPPPESRLLTRELFYTAITRAKDRVVVVGSPDDVRAAIDRRVVRATGLRQRFASAP